MSNKTEQWVPARYLKSNGEMLYFKGVEVSNFGRVRHVKDGYEYPQYEINSGYIKCAKGFVHRLVLSSFTDNIDGSLQVNHKDENKYNNHLDNLEWMTRHDNLNYGTRNERSGAAHKGLHWKLSDETKRKISENYVGTKGKHWRLNSDGKREYF